jgi:methionyl-tRNA synthetase
MVTRYQAGVIGDSIQAEHDMQAYHEAMEHLEFNKAIDVVWGMIRSLNQYIENVKPWEIAKRREKDPEAEGHLSEVLGHGVGSLLQIADLLVPFLPDTAAAIHATFETGVIVPSNMLFPKIYIHTPDPRAPKVA